MKYSTYFYVKHLATTGVFPSHTETIQHQPLVKRRSLHHNPMLRSRRGWTKSWSMVLYGTMMIMAPLLTASIFLPTILDAYETSCTRLEDRFDKHGNSTYNAAVWSTELSSLVSPIKCHSHNDYWRRHPLFSALAVGCVSVEADVWLSQNGEDLLVGHYPRYLSPTKTLRSLYIEPLLQILNSINHPASQRTSNSATQARGVFITEPNMTLILLIDVKYDPLKTWSLVHQQLEPLRDMGYLSRHDRTMNANQSFWPGPITVVGTGDIVKLRDINIAPDLVEWKKRHDVFLDAPLHMLTETGLMHSDGFHDPYKLENEFYTASAPFKKAIGSVWAGFSNQQIDALRNQLRIAKQRNLRSRLWGLPGWPISYRDYVWKVLVEEGIGLLNANNIASAAAGHWGSGYVRKAAWMYTVMFYMFLYIIGLIWYSRRLTVRRPSNRRVAV